MQCFTLKPLLFQALYEEPIGNGTVSLCTKPLKLQVSVLHQETINLPCHSKHKLSHHPLKAPPWPSDFTDWHWNHLVNWWILLHGKKQDGLQSCRGLNQIRAKYQYPLPLAPFSLEQHHTAQIFTKLNLLYIAHIHLWRQQGEDGL